MHLILVFIHLVKHLISDLTSNSFKLYCLKFFILSLDRLYDLNILDAYERDNLISLHIWQTIKILSLKFSEDVYVLLIVNEYKILALCLCALFKIHLCLD